MRGTKFNDNTSSANIEGSIEVIEIILALKFAYSKDRNSLEKQVMKTLAQYPFWVRGNIM